MGWIPAAELGLSAFGAFKGAGGGAQIDWGQLQRYADALNPQGSLSPEDYAAAEGTRKGLMSVADRTYEGQASRAMQRAAGRGMATSPANETTLKQLQETEGLNKEHAGEVAQGQLYNTWLGNKNFARQKDMALLSSRLGGAARDQGYQNLRNASWYNSMLDLGGKVIDHFGGGGAGGTYGGSGPTGGGWGTGQGPLPEGGDSGGSSGGGGGGGGGGDYSNL